MFKNSQFFTREKLEEFQISREEFWHESPRMHDLHYIVLAVCSGDTLRIKDQFDIFGRSGCRPHWIGAPELPMVLSDCFSIASKMEYPHNMKVMCAIIEGVASFLISDREYNSDVNIAYLLSGSFEGNSFHEKSPFWDIFSPIGTHFFHNDEDWWQGRYSNKPELKEYFEIFHELSFYPFLIWYLLRFHLRHQPLEQNDDVLLYVSNHFKGRKLIKFNQVSKRGIQKVGTGMPDWAKSVIREALHDQIMPTK